MLHVSIHLGEHHVDHLSEGGLRSVFINWTGRDDMNCVLGLEGGQQGAVVHFTVYSDHYGQQCLKTRDKCEQK